MGERNLVAVGRDDRDREPVRRDLSGERDLAGDRRADRRGRRRERCRRPDAGRPRTGCRRARTRAARAPSAGHAHAAALGAQRAASAQTSDERRATSRVVLRANTGDGSASVRATCNGVDGLVTESRGRARSGRAGEPRRRAPPPDAARPRPPRAPRPRRATPLSARPAARRRPAPRTSVISPLGGSANRSASSASVPRTTSSKRFVSSRQTAARPLRHPPASAASDAGSRRGDSKATTGCGQRDELVRQRVELPSRRGR